MAKSEPATAPEDLTPQGRTTPLEERAAQFGARLSPKRRALLQRILDNPDETFFLSLRRLAQHLEVDPATISRTIQALGFDGFESFAQELRRHFVSRVTPYSVMRSANEERRTVADHVEHGLLRDLENYSRMKAGLDQATLERAAQQLCQARKVLVVGLDLAFSMSYWLAYTLTLIGINAEAPQDRALLSYKTKLLTRDDALVAISFRRCMKSTVEALIAANEHRAMTIALTDSEVNPLGRRAGVTLVSSIESGVPASIVAPMGLINALVTACAQTRAAHTLDLLRDVHREYEEGDRWFAEETQRNA